MIWGIVLENVERTNQPRTGPTTHPLRATIHRAPLVGSLRNAKSRDGSHISVSVFGRYPPTDDVMFFVRCNDRRRRLDDMPPLFFFLSSTNASYPPSSAPAPSRLSTLPDGLVAWSSLLLLRSEEHTAELQSHVNLVRRLLLEKKK